MHYLQAIANLEALKLNLSTLVGNELVNEALDNIRLEKDINGMPLKPRSAKAKRNRGRKLLVDSGEGRRSIRSKKSGNTIKLEARDYMVAHNEGVNKTVSVRSRKGRTFSRKMNLPQREFSGDSPKQRKRIDQLIARQIIKAVS
jgi:phage gpG-like protein